MRFSKLWKDKETKNESVQKPPTRRDRHRILDEPQEKKTENNKMEDLNYVSNHG